MRSSNSTAFWGVSDHAPISFCPLNSQSSPGSTLTLLTAAPSIRSSAYFLNAAAGSSGVGAIVTVAVIPSGPASLPPISPEVADIDQPSGTPTVIFGASGSLTWATIRTAGLIGCEQAIVIGGTRPLFVGTTPNIHGSDSCRGCARPDGTHDPPRAPTS